MQASQQNDTYTAPAIGATTAYGNAHLPTSPGGDLTFGPQKNFAQITTREGDEITSNLECKVEQGFFLSDDAKVTCYRRNHFSVQIDYSLFPYPYGKQLYLEVDGLRHRIGALAVTLSGTADSIACKEIELVQWNTKRDQSSALERKKLLPTSPDRVATYPPNLAFQDVNDSSASRQHSSVPAFSSNFYKFERIQFKHATANNSKRRSEQQFYYLNVQLLADIRIGENDEPIWKKIAHRTGPAVVVRGRPPSHYSRMKPGASEVSNSFGPTGATVWRRESLDNKLEMPLLEDMGKHFEE